MYSCICVQLYALKLHLSLPSIESVQLSFYFLIFPFKFVHFVSSMNTVLTLLAELAKKREAVLKQLDELSNEIKPILAVFENPDAVKRLQSHEQADQNLLYLVQEHKVQYLP